MAVILSETLLYVMSGREAGSQAGQACPGYFSPGYLCHFCFHFVVDHASTGQGQVFVTC